MAGVPEPGRDRFRRAGGNGPGAESPARSPRQRRGAQRPRPCSPSTRAGNGTIRQKAATKEPCRVSARQEWRVQSPGTRSRVPLLRRHEAPARWSWSRPPFTGLPHPAFHGGKVVGLDPQEVGAEHFPPRNDDDVEAKGGFVAPEDLAHEAFGPVALHGRSVLSCGGNPQTRPLPPVLEKENRHQPPADPAAAVVDRDVLGSAAHPFLRAKAFVRTRGAVGLARGGSAWRHGAESPGYSSDTVRRFRPFARRRASTCWPSWVFIRFRNPWVFLR